VQARAIDDKINGFNFVIRWVEHDRFQCLCDLNLLLVRVALQVRLEALRDTAFEFVDPRLDLGFASNLARLWLADVFLDYFLLILLWVLCLYFLRCVRRGIYLDLAIFKGDWALLGEVNKIFRGILLVQLVFKLNRLLHGLDDDWNVDLGVLRW